MTVQTPDPRGLLRELPLRAVAGLATLAVLRAAALVLLAEGVAAGIAALAAGRPDGIPAAAALGSAGGLARAVLGWASTVLTARAAAAAKAQRRRLLVDAVADGRAGSGASTLATTGLDALDDFWLATVPAAVGAVAVPVVVGIRLVAADWPSAVIVALTLPLVPVFMALIGQHSRDRTAEAQELLARLADYLVDLAAGLPVLVGLGRAGEQRRALADLQRRYSDSTRRTLRTAMLSALALELIATISVALVAVVLGLRLLSGGVDLGAALVVLILAPECFGALREVGAAFHSSERGLDALGRVRAALDRPRPARAGAGPAGARAGAGPAAPASGVELDLVAVRFADAPPVGPLRLRIAVGESVALTGPSGSGKSTALAALTGTLPEDARLSGTASAPDALGVARQDPRFARRTIRDELALHGSEEGGRALAASLGLGVLLDADPADLSLGERRRLAVARALLRVDVGATALLLDEPTAHLDPASADAVLRELDARRARCAILVVSHDPRVMAWADRTLRMPTPAVPDTDAPLVPPAVTDPDAPPALAASSAPASPSAPAAPSALARPLTDTPAPPAPAVPPASPRPRAFTPDHYSGASAPAVAGVTNNASADAPTSGARARRIAAVALAVLTSASALALTGLSGWLIVSAAEEPAIMYLTVAIVGVRFFGIARAALRYLERLVEHDAALRTTDALRLRLWTAIAARGAGARRLLEGGDAADALVVRLERLRELLPRVSPPLAAGVAAAIGVVVATGLTVPAALPATAALAIGGLAAGWAVALATTRAAALGTESARSALVREVGALSAAAVDLRSNGVSEAARAPALAAIDASARAERRVALGAGLGSAIAVLSGSLLATLVPAVSGSAAPALVAVVALLALAVVDPLTGAVATASRAVALRDTRRSLRPLLRAHPTPSGDGRLDERLDRVELTGLAVRWPGAPRDAVRGVDAVLDRSAWTVLDGPSGAGKSTVLSALMAAVPPSAGRIAFDGVPADLLAPESIRAHVAWCPQDAHVFDSTLRGNLRIARPREDPPSDAEALAVLRRVGLGRLVPDAAALGRRVGSRGGRLSGGERQRLAVARTLLSRADVVLLDEPTAHLDEPTADALIADLRAALADRIVVLVSHRAADRRPGDRIVRLGRAAADAAQPRGGATTPLTRIALPYGRVSPVSATVAPRAAS